MTTADRIGDTHPVTLSVDLGIVISIEETSLSESEGPGDSEVKRQWEGEGGMGRIATAGTSCMGLRAPVVLCYNVLARIAPQTR